MDPHARNGVEIRRGEQLPSIAVAPDTVTLVTATGILAVDQVLVGVGVFPETSLLEQAALMVHNGMVVDQKGRTSDPAIYASGDVTNQSRQYHGRPIRLDSWAKHKDNRRRASCARPQRGVR